MNDPASSEPTNKRPGWADQFLRQFKAGVAHGYILHFNVQDYVRPGRLVGAYLTGTILGKREIVVEYDRAGGITFGSPAQRARALEILGPQVGGSGGRDSALLAALGAAGGPTPPAATLPKAPAAALPLLEQLLQQAGASVAVVINYAELLCPPTDLTAMSADDRTILTTLLRWGRDPQIAAAGNPIFLVTQTLTDLHPALRAANAKYEALEVPLPDLAARLSFIEDRQSRGAADDFDWALTAGEMAMATAGLSLIHIEDIFLRAVREGTLTRELVRERKSSIIASEFADVIEIVEPDFGFDALGGLAEVKAFFRDSVIGPLRSGDLARCPQGVLLLGPPGCGKTAMAQALAREAGVNFINLSLAKIFQGLVGASERNLEKALAAIASMSPTIVFIDEIDQAVQRGGTGDSGVSNRVFKRLLEFMSDTRRRGRVLFLGATNRPDLLDAALLRPGRFDKKIVFPPPDKSERAEIIRALAERYTNITIGDYPLPLDVLDLTENWTGAELESLVVKAIEVQQDGRASSFMDALRLAVTRLRPSTGDIERMMALALAQVNDLDLLPARYAASFNRAVVDSNAQLAASELPTYTRGARDL